jgi:hypothetical protein
MVAGKAMIKLKEMAAALSFNPIFFTCSEKKTTTSNNGIPLNPGIIICLLFLIKKAIGGKVIIIFSNLVNTLFVLSLFF